MQVMGQSIKAGPSRTMQENITIREGQPSDAPQIASLIMQAMSDECCRYFYGEENTSEDFHRLMTALVERRDTQYSYQNTICATDENDNTIGAIVCYDGADLHRLRRPFIDALKRVFGRDFSDMADETAAGELYLDSLAVDPAYRGRGIATRLLQSAVERARRSGIGPAGLLVDENNPKAEKLYLSIGFKNVGTNQWGGHAMKHL